MKQQKYIRYILLPTTLLCLIASLFCGCSANSGKISKTGFYFDTMITVTLYGTRDEKILDDCFSLAGNYEKKLSNTITDSEVSKINEANGQFVTVSSDTLSLIKDGIRYGKISDGTFDITIGTLSDLWNFSEIAETAKSDENEVDASVVPSPEKIEAALAHVNYKNIEIKGNQVRLKDPQAKIDLGGIAKGFIADEMRSFLNKKGITSGVISLGGNVLTLGKKADHSSYTIGIQKPFSETGTSLGTLNVSDASVVSSGIYERYYRVNSKLYHHILDTSTGYPVENHLYQVTIISDISMDGDALSTTCFSLGLKKECSWWNRPMAWKPSLSPMTEQLHAVPESTGMIPYSFMPPDFRVLKTLHKNTPCRLTLHGVISCYKIIFFGHFSAQIPQPVHFS